MRFRGEGPEDDDCTPRTVVSELSRVDMDKDAKALGETSVEGALEVNEMGGVEIEKVGTVVVLHFDPEDVSRPNAGPKRLHSRCWCVTIRRPAGNRRWR